MSLSLAFPVAPMKASMGAAAAVTNNDDWAYEVKWDGYRTIAFVEAGTVRLQSSAGHDVTHRWPEFSDLAESLNAESAILDAELIVADDDGRPDFSLVQAAGFGQGRTATLQLFDVLHVNGTDTMSLAYLDRRRLLDSLVEPTTQWAVPRHHRGDGAALLEATAGAGLEGIVAKRVDSTYRPGTRSADWVKVKHRQTVDLLVGGYTEGTGARSSTFGSLLLGRRVGDRLAFAGGVGTGFDQASLDRLHRQLQSIRIEHCPFDPAPPARQRRAATWVEPLMVATVDIAEFTNDGAVRHASFRGARLDTDRSN